LQTIQQSEGDATQTNKQISRERNVRDALERERERETNKEN
jgi:hypothetical protein